MPAGVLTSIDPGFAGELIDPDHPDYDRARRLDNDVFHKRPALIARCTSAADMQIDPESRTGQLGAGLTLAEIDPVGTEADRKPRPSEETSMTVCHPITLTRPRSCSWMRVSSTSKIAHQASAA